MSAGEERGSLRCQTSYCTCWSCHQPHKHVGDVQRNVLPPAGGDASCKQRAAGELFRLRLCGFTINQSSVHSLFGAEFRYGSICRILKGPGSSTPIPWPGRRCTPH
ncbi:hypothetical protein TgHK011_008503 [Trichoderma gracile]|nr:hypothetical protein TgHK011_008503 [Trichoderma gracile]